MRKTLLVIPVGTRYGRLVTTALPVAASIQRRRFSVVDCRCDCGTERAFRTKQLRSGMTRSCGCLHREVSAERVGKLRLGHGHSRGRRETPTLKTWHSMMSRCNSATAKSFSDYGGRGIRVCDRWQSFENFLADMGERPNGTTIDRIDVNGNYEPSNCRWASWKQQQRNRRTSRLATAFGKTMCVAAWAEETGVAARTIYARLARPHRWTTERALTEPAKVTPRWSKSAIANAAST